MDGFVQCNGDGPRRLRLIAMPFGLREEKTTMTLNVCPADTVHAPVERVWDLLMQPAGYRRFWELTVERVEPEGPARRAVLHAALRRRLHDPPGWQGWLWRRLRTSAFHKSVEDSLQQLKRAAEGDVQQTGPA